MTQPVTGTTTTKGQPSVHTLLTRRRLRFLDQPSGEPEGPPAEPQPGPDAPPAPAPQPPAPRAAAPQRTVNDHGYPDSTPVAEMTPQQQAAYWRTQSKKHEARSLTALGFTDAQVDAIAAARAENPGLVAERFAGYDELTQRVDDLERARATAVGEAEVARAVAAHHVAAEDAALLDGLTGERLTALAQRLGQGEGIQAPAAPSTDWYGSPAGPVSGPRQIATREEYAAMSPDERRAARTDGRLNHLLGVTR